MRYRLGQRRSTTRLRSSRRVGLGRHRSAPKKPTAPPRPSSSCLSQSKSPPGRGASQGPTRLAPKPVGRILRWRASPLKQILPVRQSPRFFTCCKIGALLHCSSSWKDGSAAVARAALFFAAQLRRGRRRISGGCSPAQSLSKDLRGERILERQDPQSTQSGRARECSLMMLRAGIAAPDRESHGVNTFLHCGRRGGNCRENPGAETSRLFLTGAGLRGERRVPILHSGRR